MTCFLAFDWFGGRAPNSVPLLSTKPASVTIDQCLRWNGHCVCFSVVAPVLANKTAHAFVFPLPLLLRRPLKN